MIKINLLRSVGAYNQGAGMTTPGGGGGWWRRHRRHDVVGPSRIDDRKKSSRWEDRVDARFPNHPLYL